MLDLNVIYYWIPSMIENFRFIFIGLFYFKYPMKSDTAIIYQLIFFHVTHTFKIVLKFNTNLKFQTSVGWKEGCMNNNRGCNIIHKTIPDKFNWNSIIVEIFTTSGGGYTILGGEKRSPSHSQPSSYYELINFYLKWFSRTFKQHKFEPETIINPEKIFLGIRMRKMWSSFLLE